MRCLGLEPRTPWLKVMCSSDWANTAECFLGLRGSNYVDLSLYGGLSRLSLCDNLVRNVGLEPTRRRRQNLNLVRLPISPHPHTRGWYLCTDGHHSTRSIMISLMTSMSEQLGHFDILLHPNQKIGGWFKPYHINKLMKLLFNFLTSSLEGFEVS